MSRDISAILALKTIEDMSKAFESFDTKSEERLARLEELLDNNLLSPDVVSLQLHMSEVESFRSRVVRLLACANGFVYHAKSSQFLPVKNKGITDTERKAFQYGIYAGFAAWVSRLEGYLLCIDSRVNLAKKMLGIDFDGSKGRHNSYV